jgi:prepilin-type N-terminal cleavage/methylation domain-containing protein
MQKQKALSPALHSTVSSGFTLVELLVVIAIASVLISILMPSLSLAKKSAQDLRSMNNLRQMLLGYTYYHQDNRGWVLFGHTPPILYGSAVTVTDSRSGHTFGYPISDRYPWHLVKHVSNIWDVIHSHTKVPPLPTTSDSAHDAMMKAYMLSIDPTFGINSIYVGGDADYAGFIQDRPNIGKHVVFKTSEVRRPTELIVFADSHATNMPSMVGDGYHLLTAPRARGVNWVVEGSQIQVRNKSIMGIPKGWFTKRVITGFFDGHVEGLLPDQLQDMRKWANWADSPDYDYAPQK